MHLGQSTARIVADALVALPAGDRGTASEAAQHDRIFDACLLPSQLLLIEMLRRPVESAQYASKAFRRLLKTNGFKGSMSRRGDCWDNAVVESFFGSLKQERVQWRSYQTRYEAQQDVLNYIEMFYNRYRLHSYLGYISPDDFEVQLSNMKDVA
jgi:hypothetical protein